MTIGASKYFFFTMNSGSTPAIGTSAFVKLDLGVRAKRMKLIAESADVTFSFNGSDTHGVLKAADGAQDFDEIGASAIWVKGTGATLRVWAWQGED